jgi:hypothetical protein
MACGPGSLKTDDAANVLFKTLPSNWYRLTLVYGNAGINENNESVRLCAYTDDANYLEVARRFRGGRRFEGRVEVAGVSTDLPGPIQSGFDAGALRITNKGNGNYLGEYASSSMDDWTPIGDTNGAMSGAQDYDRIAVYTAEGPAAPSSQLTPEFQRVIIEAYLPGEVEVSPHYYDSVNRDNSKPLANQTVSGNLYCHVPTYRQIVSVSFWIDDPDRQGPAYFADTTQPYFDLQGARGAGWNPPYEPFPYDTTALANGEHTITVNVLFTSGNQVVTIPFNVDN